MKFSHATQTFSACEAFTTSASTAPNQVDGTNCSKTAGTSTARSYSQDPKCTSNTPQQVADRERQYMELQSIIAQANQRTLQTADQQMSNKPKNQPICWPRVNKAQTTRQPPYQPIPVQTWRQKLQLLNIAIGRLRPVHNHYLAKDQAHLRPYPRANQKRIPRVPACYPPTLNLQHNKDEEQQQPQKEQPAADNDTPTEESSPADTPKESPETQATGALLLAALSPPVNPGRTLTLPQRISRPYRTWRRQPVRE